MCDEDQQEESTNNSENKVLNAFDQSEDSSNVLDQSEVSLKVETCAQYQRQSKLNFYPVNVEKFNLLINADAEAFDFCQRENYFEDECPYVFNIRWTQIIFPRTHYREKLFYVLHFRSLPGRLVSINGSVLKYFNGTDVIDGDELRSLTVEDFLEAAGVSLEDDTLR